MREITVPVPNWDEVTGTAIVYPVVVDWPELQLTKDQILANAVASLDGLPDPYPNNAIFSVRITRP